jgi:uncharacterized membrane protein YgdD (TMEM256/DUF423 family)
MTRVASQRRWWLLGAVNGALVVGLGAYGAHALNDSARAALWQTAVHYHMFHTLALFAVGMAAAAFPRTTAWSWVGGLMIAGILLFCGSLYLTAAGATVMRGLAPIGGGTLIGAWALFVFAILRSR